MNVTSDRSLLTGNEYDETPRTLVRKVLAVAEVSDLNFPRKSARSSEIRRRSSEIRRWSPKIRRRSSEIRRRSALTRMGSTSATLSDTTGSPRKLLRNMMKAHTSFYSTPRRKTRPVMVNHSEDEPSFVQSTRPRRSSYGDEPSYVQDLSRASNTKSMNTTRSSDQTKNDLSVDRSPLAKRNSDKPCDAGVDSHSSASKKTVKSDRSASKKIVISSSVTISPASSSPSASTSTVNAENLTSGFTKTTRKTFTSGILSSDGTPPTALVGYVAEIGSGPATEQVKPSVRSDPNFVDSSAPKTMDVQDEPRGRRSRVRHVSDRRAVLPFTYTKMNFPHFCRARVPQRTLKFVHELSEKYLDETIRQATSKVRRDRRTTITIDDMIEVLRE